MRRRQSWQASDCATCGRMGRFTDAAGPLRGTRPTGEVGNVLILDTVSVSQADGSGRLSGSASYELASGRYSTSLEGADWQLVPTEDRPVRGLVSLRFTGMGTLEAPQGDGEIVVRDAAVQNTELGELTASIALEAGPAARIEARAPDVSTTATARVQIAAPYDAVIDVRTDRLDLARVLTERGNTRTDSRPRIGVDSLRGCPDRVARRSRIGRSDIP